MYTVFTYISSAVCLGFFLLGSLGMGSSLRSTWNREASAGCWDALSDQDVSVSLLCLQQWRAVERLPQALLNLLSQLKAVGTLLTNACLSHGLCHRAVDVLVALHAAAGMVTGSSGRHRGTRLRLLDRCQEGQQYSSGNVIALPNLWVFKLSRRWSCKSDQTWLQLPTVKPHRGLE